MSLSSASRGPIKWNYSVVSRSSDIEILHPIANREILAHSLCEGAASQNSVANYTKIGGRSSAIRTGSRLEGVADNAQ